MKKKQSPEDVFMELGFNNLEAEVYVALLRNGPQTAYRIGKLVNRPTANVYKAVDALCEKGAVEVDESEVKICKAIAIDSVGKQLEMEYKNRISRAVETFQDIRIASSGSGIYSLQSVEAVFQRAKEMLGRCKKVAVADLFPAPMELLLDDIRELAAKGADVMLEAYSAVSIEGVSVAMPEVSGQTLKYWKAQQLNLAIDGEEILVALFNEDMTELIQANYSNNLYLSCIMYAGMRSEHQFLLLSGAKTMEEVNALKKGMKFFVNTDVPGLDLLFKQYK